MKKILIVEDTPFNLDLLVQLLEDDYQVVTARDGQAGVIAANTERPDLILMDMALPILNGWDATKKIKAIPALRDIPIIALTSHAMSGDKEKALAAGCDDYMTKPLDENLLFEKLERLLNSRTHHGALNRPG